MMETATKIITHPVAVVAFNAINIVAGMAPIPGGDTIPGLVLQIQARLQEAKWRKEDCADLSQHVGKLEEAFKRQQRQVEETNLSSASGQVITLLENILRRVEKWSKYPTWKVVLNTNDLKSDIAECRRKIDDALAQFQVESHLEIHATFKLQNQKLDRILDRVEPQEIVKAVARVKQQRPSSIEEYERMYSEFDIIYEGLLEGGSKADADLKLGQAHVPRAYYNTLALLVQKTLKDLHANMKSYPVPDLKRKVVRLEMHAFDGSYFTDLYRGKLVTEEKLVVLKTVRGIASFADKAVLRFNNEIKVWAQLKHEHIQKIYGYSTQCGTAYVALVAPYCKRRNLLVYINRSSWHAHRLRLLKEAASGMEYLHKQRVVHGNLKAANVLITDELTAVISDFQMSKLMLDAAIDQGLNKQTYTRQPSPRWTAPELSQQIVPWFPIDIWSFGMVMIEAFTCKRPLDDYRRDTSVTSFIAQGGIPDRPDCEPWVTDAVWDLMRDCWKWNPEERPSFTEIRERLEEAQALYDKGPGFGKHVGDDEHDGDNFDRIWAMHDLELENDLDKRTRVVSVGEEQNESVS